MTMGSKKGKKWRKGHLQPEELDRGPAEEASPALLRGLNNKSNGGGTVTPGRQVPRGSPVSRDPTEDRMASPQRQQAQGPRSGAGCPPTGLNPRRGRARGRGPGVGREDPGRPSPHTGRTDSQGSLDQLWLVPTQQESQVHQAGHGGLADPAETRRG